MEVIRQFLTEFWSFFDLGFCGQKSTCSEHGRVAYQIKGNHKCSSVVANILPADPAPMVMLHIKLKGMGHRAPCKHPQTPPPWSCCISN